MTEQHPPKCADRRFTHAGHEVVIRNVEDRVELEIDGERHEVRFLDNGRPYTSSYVNAMAVDVVDYAERFIDFAAAQQAHWDRLRREGGES